jgi:7-cyano-7-deazaguanine synthase
MKEKAVVVLSGGQDSTTCLYWAIHQGYEVSTVSIDYGQRHSIELESAKVIAKLAGVPNIVIEIPGALQGTSPLVSTSNLEQYDDVDNLPKGLEKTFVPMRNQLFITLAANYAYCIGANTVVYGCCAEDSEGYPDCRLEFISALEQSCNAGTFVDNAFKILVPLLHLSKADTVRLASSLTGCMDALALSHTAYDGKYPPTGMDHASILRRRGFEEAGVPDPLVIRAAEEGLMELPTTYNYKGV